MAKLEVIPVAQVEDNHTWAVYGRSGTGKTTFAGTFPKPILLVDLKDKGTRSVKTVKDLFVTQLDKLGEVEDLYYALLKDKTFQQYKTIVFDTVTQLQDMVGRSVYAKRVGDNADLSRWGEWGNLTLKEWGTVGATMKDHINNFTDLPKREIMFLAQERQNDNEDAPLWIGPALTPAVVNALNANVEIIVNTFIRNKTKEEKGKKTKEPVYSMRVGPDSTYITKVRKPKEIKLPPFVDDPTYVDIMDIIKGD